MDLDNLDNNTMVLIIKVEDDGTLSVGGEANLDDDLGIKETNRLTSLLHGIINAVENGPDFLISIGQLEQYAFRLQGEQDEDDSDFEITFEPDQKLLKSISDPASSILMFRKKGIH
jgi:hypothetical protein